ncbi:hypothetical protein FS749_014702 [Ceratobasidium sp. UAMH 11750]|nr:hypothetical protein FS749_014702 [Ceratobasidium sp. UAMH 11750]
MASGHPGGSGRAIRRHIQEIALTPIRTTRPIDVKILVDNEEMHRLARIEKGQPLIWKDLMLPCDLRNDSVFTVQVTEVHRATPDITGAATCPARSIIDRDNVTIGCDDGKFTLKGLFMGHDAAKTAYEDALARVQQMERPTSLLNKYGRYGAAFTTLLALGTALSELDPSGSAKVAFSVCTKAWQHLEKQEKQDKDIHDFVEQLARMTPTIKSVQDVADAHLQDTIADMLNLIEDASLFILGYRSRSIWGRAFSGFIDSSVQDRTKDLIENFGKLREEFDRRVGTQTLKVGTRAFATIRSDSDRTSLKELNPVGQASYNPSCGCTPDTRVRVIEDTVRWAQDDVTDKQLLWIYGFTGLGKSSIATSVCLRLKEEGLLASSFFCKRDDPLLRDAGCLLNTVIFELGTRHEGYRRAVVNAIQDDPQICTAHIQRRYASLVEAPLKSLGLSESSGPYVIVIDALDETKRDESRSLLLTYLRKMCELVPWIRIIVTSRPDDDIKTEFGGDGVASLNIADHDAVDDILTFVRQRMVGIAKKRKIEEWPDDKIRRLANCANGLFVWAETACKFIAGGFSPLERLEQVLQVSQSTAESHPLAGLDSLYSTAIQAGMEDDGEDNRRDVVRCIGAIIATSSRTPLPVASLEQLLSRQIKPGVLRSVVGSLGSVVHEDGGPGGSVRMFHPSFEDFMTDLKRSGQFYVDLTQQNTTLADCCLGTMLQDLKFNICGIETSHIFNRNILDLPTRVQNTIAPHLRYSCLYWYSHLAQAEMAAAEKSLGRFLFERELIYWLEVLSLIGKLDVALSSMTGLANLTLKSHKPTGYSSYASDIHRFVLSFYDAISESTPHLYISALPFAPTASEFGKRMRPLFPNTLTVAQGMDERWSSCLRNISHPDIATSVAFSPDSRRLVSGCNDATVRLWEAETGAATLDPLQGHSKLVQCVAFSPNGRHIASSSYDYTIRVWDASTGSEACAPLKCYSGVMFSIAFSPNSRQIVSGSADHTVRIWDVETAAVVLGPLKGHSGWVNGVAFSPDGRYIASGSHDTTVRVWDAETGAVIYQPLRGHSGPVASVVFSVDGSLIASGSTDFTLIIWDAKTGTQKLGPLRGHTSLVQSVAFSPDDRRILSGSADGTVRFWDVESGHELVGQPRSHLHRVWYVAFSPDGQRVASASADKTVRIWDVEPGVAVQSALQCRSAAVMSVVFSSDGHLILSGSNDHLLRVWDASTGAAVGEPLQGHSDRVKCVAFSPNGRRIASGSSDNTLRIWDTETGATVLGPLHGHSDWVRSVTFSPDARLLASGSRDTTVRIWDVETGAAHIEPLRGHTGPVRSVAFSPDGRTLISASHDMTIRVWDVETGASLLGPPWEHSGGVNSVAFSADGKYIASGADDFTVRIWDAKTGTITQTLRGHSEKVLSVAFSPDSRLVASCSLDQTIRIWATATGTSVLKPLQGHSHHVRSVAFSPDGCSIVSGSDDGTIRIWDVNRSYAVTESLSSLGDRLLTLATSELAHLADPNGWVSSSSGELLLWLPGNYRRIDDSVMCISPEPVGPQPIVNFSLFAHGNSWPSVAAV